MTIGGFESAWLGDLAVPFILEQNMVKWHFDDTLQKGIYRDDGLTILNRKTKKKDVAMLLDSFQQAINYYATNILKIFTVTIWRAYRDDRSKHPIITIDMKDFFRSWTWNYSGEEKSAHRFISN